MCRKLLVALSGAGLVLSVLAWCASLARVSYFYGPDFYGLWNGAFCYHQYPDFRYKKPVLSSLLGTRGIDFEMHWVPYIGRHPKAPDIHVIRIPLWIPAAVFGGVLFPMVRPLLQQRRWRRAGLCASCGYDVHGVRVRCPECGEHATRRCCRSSSAS